MENSHKDKDVTDALLPDHNGATPETLPHPHTDATDAELPSPTDTGEGEFSAPVDEIDRKSVV